MNVISFLRSNITQVRSSAKDSLTKFIKSKTNIKDNNLGDLSYIISYKVSMIKCMHDLKAQVIIMIMTFKFIIVLYYEVFILEEKWKLRVFIERFVFKYMDKFEEF